MKFLVSLFASRDTAAERERTSHHTIARQLDTEAMSHSIKLEAGVTVPPIPILRIPDFWR